MRKHKILIATHYYHPEITPRAFRACELVKGFLKAGWEVTLATPKGVYTGEALEVLNGAQKSCNDFIRNNEGGAIKKRLKAIVRKVSPGSPDEVKGMFRIFSNLPSGDYDVVFSVGLPFTVHIAVFFKKMIGVISANVWVADYGDPYTIKERKNGGFICASILERYVLKRFEYISVPIAAAFDAYEKVCPKEKLVVIPQGVDFSQFEVGGYIKGPVPRFAYAGAFYSDLRNPEKLFDCLASLDLNFEFHLYANMQNQATRYYVDKYMPKLGDRLIVHNRVSRSECIYELSLYDFLINIDNDVAVQSPSKLIDYSLSGRPVMSFRASEFNENDFMRFLDGDYALATDFDVSSYSIDVVVNDISSLREGNV